MHTHAHTHSHTSTQAHTHTRSEKEWVRVRDECTELNGQPIIELTNVNIKHRRHPYEYNSVLCCYFFWVFFWIVFRYAIYFSFWSCCFSLIYVRISLESDVFFFSSPPSSSFNSVGLWCCSVSIRVYMHTLFETEWAWACVYRLFVWAHYPFSRYATPFFLLIIFFLLLLISSNFNELTVDSCA